MLFIFSFIFLILTIPVLIDIRKNGSDNILKKSGNEFIALKWVSKVFDFLNLSKTFLNGIVTLIIGIIVFFLVVSLIIFLVIWIV
mgnify:CR=1 FL=1